MSELVKRYVTKYALTKGVLIMEGRDNPDFDNYFQPPDWYMGLLKTIEAHSTWEEALAKAESMRLKKIASHRAQIAKLEALVFVKPEGDAE